MKIYRGHNIQEVRSATRSSWEPWKRWLVTSCDIESSRAWATCKVPHGYLDHHNAATDDDVNWCSCFFRPGWSDPWGRRQPIQPCTSRKVVATSPTAFGSQRIWDTVFFFEIVIGYTIYKTYFIEAESLSCYDKIFSRTYLHKYVLQPQILPVYCLSSTLLYISVLDSWWEVNVRQERKLHRLAH